METFICSTDGGGTILRLEDEHLNLRAAANAAVELAQVVERVRARHPERAEREANAALRRRYGLPRSRALWPVAPSPSMYSSPSGS
jgi:hypothetical protein